MPWWKVAAFAALAAGAAAGLIVCLLAWTPEPEWVWLKWSGLATVTAAAGVGLFVLLRDPRYLALRALVTTAVTFVMARFLPTEFAAAAFGEVGGGWISARSTGPADWAVVSLVVVLGGLHLAGGGVAGRLKKVLHLNFGGQSADVETGGVSFQTHVGGSGNSVVNNIQQGPDLAAEVDADLARAADLMQRGKFREAATLLQRLQNLRWETMTPRQRFLTLANLGVAILASGQEREAGRLMLDAGQADPDHPRSVATTAWGHQLLGDAAEAARQAERALADDPSERVAVCVWVSSSETAEVLRTRFAELADSARQDPEVLIAAARTGLWREDWGFARERAREACDAGADRSEADGLEAAALIAAAHPVRLGDHRGTLSTGDRLGVERAEHLLSNLLQNPLQGPPRPGVANASSLSRLRYHRGLARDLLGRESASADDMAEAAPHLKEREDAGYLYIASEILWRNGRRERAEEALRAHLTGADPPAGVIVAQYAHLVATGGFESRRGEALTCVARALRTGNALDATDRPILIREGLRLAALTGSRNAGSTLLDRLPELPAVVGLTCQAEYHHMLGEVEAAGGVAGEALSALAAPDGEALPPELDRLTSGWLARLLHRLEQHAEAFDVFARFVPRDAPSPDAGLMAEAGHLGGRTAEVLAFCKSLRAAGVLVPTCREVEVLSHMRVEVLDRAAAVAEESAAASADPRFAKRMRFLRSLCGVRADRADWVEANADRLPSFEEVTGRDRRTLTHIYCHPGGPGRLEAVKLLYPLARPMPDDSATWWAYLHAVMFAPGNLTLPEPAAVAPGCAAGLRETDAPENPASDPPLWWAVHDPDCGPAVDALRELPSHHHNAERLLGKAVGDVVLLEEGGLPIRRKIGQIIERYGWLARRMLETFENRFPNEPLRMLSIPMGSGGTPDLTALLRQLETRQRRVKDMMRHYQAGAIPMAMLSQHVGRPPLDVHAGLIAAADLHVRSTPPDVAERRSAADAIRDAGAVVLGPGAARTTLLFRLDERVPSWPVDLVVPEAILRQLRDAARDGTRRAGQGGTMFARNGQVEARDWTHNDLSTRPARIESFCDWLEQTAEVADGSPALADGRQFDRWTKVSDGPTAHAIVLAAHRNLPLWEDDLVIRAVIKTELNRPGADTFALLDLLRWARPNLPATAEVEADLFAAGYRHALPSSAATRAAGRIAEWKPNLQPLAGVFRAYSDAAFDAQSLVDSAGRTLDEIREAPISPIGDRDGCVAELMRSLATHTAGRTVLGLLTDATRGLFADDARFAMRVAEAARTQLSGLLPIRPTLIDRR